MANYIFLDVDGVLNSVSYFEKVGYETEWDVDPEAVKLLGKLCQEFDCKVILSSSWRRNLKDDLTPTDIVVKQRKWNKKHGLTPETNTDLLLRLLKENKINLIGKTDTDILLVDHLKWDRIGQIYRYIEKNLSDEDNFIILDDEDVIGEGPNRYDYLKKNFIQTDFNKKGFDEVAYEKAVQIFKETQ